MYAWVICVLFFKLFCMTCVVRRNWFVYHKLGVDPSNSRETAAIESEDITCGLVASGQGGSDSH